MKLDRDGLAERYAAVAREIPTGVTLIAVSKTQPFEVIEALYQLGHRDFGENYAQELQKKAATLASRGCSDIRWHFIGHLQSNKARLIAPSIFSVHSIDSLRLAEELARRWQQAGRTGMLPLFVEVNIDDEKSKAGVPPGDVAALCLALEAIEGLSVEGLMCIPSREGTNGFRRLAELSRLCRTNKKLSMGMTADFKEAIQFGATHVRVGTAIFGRRNTMT